MNYLRCKIFADLHISAGKMYSLHGHRASYTFVSFRSIVNGGGVNVVSFWQVVLVIWLIVSWVGRIVIRLPSSEAKINWLPSNICDMGFAHRGSAIALVKSPTRSLPTNFRGNSQHGPMFKFTVVALNNPK